MAIAMLGCSQPPPAVVLISVDTLRPDHLGCYGYSRETSPSIDSLRRDAVLFARASAHSPSTLPSHASLFSSLLPQQHGASAASAIPLPEEVLTLAEHLREAGGYRTAAFTGAGQMNSVFGLDQGFEIYREPVPALAMAVEEALDWIDSLGGEPFFVFLHTYEVHHPYEPSPDDLAGFAPRYTGELPSTISVDLLREINAHEAEIGAEDLDYIVSAYDAEIVAMDRSIGQLIEAMRSRGLYENSLIVLTSDHGEEFSEHGTVGWHSHTLYEELLRVPLILKLPGGDLAGTTVETSARLIDVAPTIVEAVGLASPPEFGGSALLGDRPSRSSPVVARIDHGSLEVESLRVEHWKWFAGRLYDLRTDPNEQRDLAAAKPELAARLEARLQQLVAEGPSMTAVAVDPDEETLEQLRALGYLQ